MHQKEVEYQLGVTLWTLINWEKGRTRPPTQYLPRIISFLGYDPAPEPKTLPDQLIAQRRKLGWSRKYAAAQLGVDEGTLQSWEQGVTVPKGRFGELVASFLVGADE